MLTVVTSDDQKFRVEDDVARQCSFLNDFVESSVNHAEEIPLLVVTGDIFSKVLEYCEHYRSSDTMNSEEPAPRDVDWDQQFISGFEYPVLQEIIKAANFLSFKPLLDLGCRRVARMIVGKTPAEIITLFNLPNQPMEHAEAQVVVHRPS